MKLTTQKTSQPPLNTASQPHHITNQLPLPALRFFNKLQPLVVENTSMPGLCLTFPPNYPLQLSHDSPIPPSYTLTGQKCSIAPLHNSHDFPQGKSRSKRQWEAWYEL